LKMLTGKPLVLDFRDDWIDTPWYRSRPGIIRAIERRMEKWVVKTADKVILVTEWSRELFQKRYPEEPEDKFIFIPNGCDLAEFADVNHMVDEEQGPKFTILHAGLLNDSSSWARSPAAFFQAVCRLRERHPELAGVLTLAFTGSLPDGHRKLAEQMGLSDVIEELGHLPRDEFLRRLKSADVLLAINYEGFSTLIPGKIYDYWAAGGPPILLLSCRGAAQELVERHGLGMVVSHEDAPAIEIALEEIYHKRTIGRPMRLRTDGIEEYDRKRLAKRLADVLSSVSDGVVRAAASLESQSP